MSLDARTVAQTEAELEVLTRDREVDIQMNTAALARNVSGVTGGLARWAPLIAAAAFGIGALVAALPALVLNVAAPLAAIALGFDGIKAAASGLKDEVEELKTSLSDTFERLLTPGFERLGSLFPTLEAGLDRVALGVSQIFDSFSRSVTSEESIATIDRTLTNIGETLSRFAELGGVDAFTDSLLLLADAGTAASVALTPEFVAAFEHFNDELERMSENGDLQKSMEGIGHGFLIIAAALEVFVLGGLKLSAMLERLGEEIYTFATETVPEAWESLKTAWDDAWDSIVDSTSDKWDELSDLAGASADEIAAYFLTLPDTLKQAGVDAIQGLWDGMTSVMEPLQKWLADKAADLLGSFGFIWDSNSPSREFYKEGRNAGEGLQLGFEDSLKGVEASATLMAMSALRAASADSLLPANVPTPDTAPRRIALTITNWHDGTGYFTEVADGAVGRQILAVG